MKMKIAVYTAQEGYSWQPGTALTADELGRFKKVIGKFPSPDSAEFPFGGIFLLEGDVVFYRYHVAKKIDFRGRDALYCVLGVVSRAEAARVVPASLFALPEFAGPMKPFPVSLDVPEADPAAVPAWLKNLDVMTLDVRISGPADNPSYAVVQNQVEAPKPPVEVVKDPTPQVPPGGPKQPVPVSDPVPPSPIADPGQGTLSAGVPGKDASPARPRSLRWIIWGAASVVLIAVLLAVALLLLGLKGAGHSQGNPSGGTEQSKTNVVVEASHQTDTNDVSSATAPAAAVPPETNSVASATNVLTAATNSAPVVEAATSSAAGKKIAPSQSSPKMSANRQKKKPTPPTGNSAAAKKTNSPKRKDSKEKR